MFSCCALHPSTVFQVEHNVLKKTFGHIVAAGEFANGYGAASMVFDQGEKCPKGVIGPHGKLHIFNDLTSGKIIRARKKFPQCQENPKHGTELHLNRVICVFWTEHSFTDFVFDIIWLRLLGQLGAEGLVSDGDGDGERDFTDPC